ncbi:MAG: DUF3572 domain-containing protein [Pseudomonadota bacterium]
MPAKHMDLDAAEAIALEAVNFLAQDPARLAHFLQETGMGPADLKQSITEKSFQAGVLTHLMADEQLLLTFTSGRGIEPEIIERAQGMLSGRAQEYQST